MWDAGREHGLVAGGYRAIDSLRLEKGYRSWSTDVTPETTPYEAGLGFCVALDKPGGFLGRDALVAARERAAGRLTPAALPGARRAPPGRPRRRAGAAERRRRTVAGRVTSGGFGYTVGASIAYAYLPAAASTPGTRVSVDVFGEWTGATVAAEPLFDPENLRVRGRYA